MKDVQRLIDHLTTLTRFISKPTNKNLPFFKVLKNITIFEWIKEFKKAFIELKIYLTNPSLFSKPKPKRVFPCHGLVRL